MVRVLLDACIPRPLRRDLNEFNIDTAQQAGLDQMPDGEMLDAIDGRYDVLVTRDRNLTYQQRIAGRRIAIVVLRSLDQSPAAFKALVPALKAAIATALPGTVTIVNEGKV